MRVYIVLDALYVILFLFPGVLVIFCCVTTSKCSSFKQQTFLSNEILWSGIKSLLTRYLWPRIFQKAAIKIPAQVFHKAILKVTAGLQSSQGSTGKGSAPKLTHMDVGRPQILTDCWIHQLLTTWTFPQGSSQCGS